MICTSRTWPRPAADARRISPAVPPLVERLVRDLVCDREQGEEAQIAEVSGQTIHAVEHQMNGTNHAGLRTFVGWVAVVGPERASRVATPVLSQLGVALVSTGEGDGGTDDPATGIVRLTERLGSLAAAHMAAWADNRLSAAELAEVERLAARLHQALEVYVSAARAFGEARR